MKLKEITAAASVVMVLVGLPVLVAFQSNRAIASDAGGAKVFTLSGVAEDGVWTLENVNAINYWWRTFDRAILHVEEGDEVVLRLQSTDVHHRFYAPELNIAPVDVEPGHTQIVRFRAGAAGTYQYYCTSICGDCHFYMSGWIVVSPKGQMPEDIYRDAIAAIDHDTIAAIDHDAIEAVDCPHDLAKPTRENMIEWGRYLYQNKGCVTCHGKDGQGDVPNFNYAKATVPAHNTLAEKLFLEEKEDADAFIELLLKRVDLDQMEDSRDIPQFRLVMTQYNSAKDLITKGKHCAKKDETGLEPPLQMPSWREVLTDRDIDCIIAYLLTLYPWDADEYEDE